MANTLDYFQQGMQLGAGFSALGDARKERKLGELTRGLSNQIVLGKNDDETYQANQQLLALDPDRYKKITEQLGTIQTPEARKLQESMGRISLASENLLKSDDANFIPNLNYTYDAFNRIGETDTANKVLEIAEIAKTDPIAARTMLQTIQQQAGDYNKALEESMKSRFAIQTDKEKNRYSNVDSLRDDVNRESASFDNTQKAYGKIQSVFDTNKNAQVASEFASKAVKNNPEVAKSTEAFGDMALTFAYMKMLDEGSTVREGEYATVQNTGGVEERIRNYYNAALNGSRLTPEQREGIRRQSEGVYKTEQKRNERNMKKYRMTAKEFGIPEEQIFNTDANTIPSDGMDNPNKNTPSQQIQEGATATNPTTGQKMVFTNGAWQQVGGR